MDEKEKNYESTERQEDFPQNREQNETHECSSAIFAWWYSLVELVFKKKNNVSDAFAISLGVCSILLVFFLLLFTVMMELKGVRFYEYF